MEIYCPVCNRSALKNRRCGACETDLRKILSRDAVFTVNIITGFDFSYFFDIWLNCFSHENDKLYSTQTKSLNIIRQENEKMADISQCLFNYAWYDIVVNFLVDKNLSLPYGSSIPNSNLNITVEITEDSEIKINGTDSRSYGTGPLYCLFYEDNPEKYMSEKVKVFFKELYDHITDNVPMNGGKA